jgi:hypothetical protein
MLCGIPGAIIRAILGIAMHPTARDNCRQGLNRYGVPLFLLKFINSTLNPDLPEKAEREHPRNNGKTDCKKIKKANKKPDCKVPQLLLLERR